jgi:hypothetical protein
LKPATIELNNHRKEVVTEVETIEARLAELEKQRDANYWNAHMGASARSYRPLPASFYAERRQLLDRLTELKYLSNRA